ncbi:AAA family ATPase [Fusobacterium massiliense]|uniref:McrB family protein n=1 Tax=Fusobacterium massiliense TaxID=1852365 RepID=UPI0028D70BBD|nr:AAA family ATPase [Fusobacterium massiliense]
MTEILDINQHFQELIIRTLGIITRNKTQKHIEISIHPLRDLFQDYYKEDIYWKFESKDSVPWLCFWSRKLAEEPANGIYPMFYSYSGKQNGQNIKYLILAFGKSVKKETNIDWDKKLPLENINDFFNKLGVEGLPTYKNEINYGTSKVYKAYIVNQEKFNDPTFQNEVYNDFKTLFEYYLAYAKYITYEKNWSKISESKEELKIAYEKELNKILETLEKLNSEKINSMVDEKEENSHIKKDFSFPLNTILYGPPGTGKTYNSVFYSVRIIEKNETIFKSKNNNEVFKKFKEYKDKNLIKFITFHQSYGYEDFIEGIRPQLENESKDLNYVIHSGIFKDMCNKAKSDKENNYVLIIDEINRGNISKIFGELISLIEPSKREGEKEEMEVILPYSKESFTIPKNLYIIGTMNTADRSIALLDIALRRRFNFIEIMPEYNVLKEVEDIKVDLLLSSINEKIEFLLDREHTIGHSYFLNISTFEELVKVFKNSIIPLLQEYFYDDFEKIKTIFSNNGFIISKNISLNNQRKSIYKLNEEALKDKNNYKKIYLSVEDEE